MPPLPLKNISGNLKSSTTSNMNQSSHNQKKLYGLFLKPQKHPRANKLLRNYWPDNLERLRIQKN